MKKFFQKDEPQSGEEVYKQAIKRLDEESTAEGSDDGTESSAPPPEDTPQVTGDDRTNIPLQLPNHNFLLSNKYIDINTTLSLFRKKVLERIYEEIDCDKIKCTQDYYIPLIQIRSHDLVQHYIGTFGNIIAITDTYTIAQYKETYLIVFLSNSNYTYNTTVNIFSDTINNIQNTLQDFREHLKDLIEDETICKVEFSWYTILNGMSKCYTKYEYIDDIFHTECYPYLDIDELISSYLDSDAPLLLLKGKPGTGKTRFIREILRRFHQKLKKDHIECAYTSSTEIIENGSVFLNLIFGDTDVLILEDIDYSLTPRKDGNTSMYNLLSISNGIMSNSMKNKKIILSTNLPNINDVDEALVRPGRCFDIIEMKQLTPDQADVVFKKLGKKRVVEQKTYTLADIYNK